MSEAEPLAGVAGKPAAAGPAAAFADAVQACASARQLDGRSMAVLVIDCGLINRIDAVWGYGVGDAVRDRIAESITADVLRPEDLAGATSRDELACLLASVDDPSQPLMAAEKILRTLAAPLWVGEEEICVDAAIGIALTGAHAEGAETLLQRAKCACLQARQSTGRIATWDGQACGELEQSLVGESRLRSAVQDDALELGYQPQYDLRLGPIMALQIHLQWRDPAAGKLTAARAFAAAEAAGTVAGLLSSILNRALRNVSEFRYSVGLDLLVCVPLPASALRHAELPEVVERALGTWRLRAGRIVFQICDTAILRAEQAARDTLLQLKKLGVRLCIDDAGMSLDSLAFLATLPFQEIRLDLSAMPMPAESPETGAAAPAAARTGPGAAGLPRPARIPGAFIALAHQLSLEVVACGVADEAAAATLKALGCEYLQADFRSPPLDAEAFVTRFG